MINYEYYDWTSLINADSRQRMKSDIDTVINEGRYWKNSPPFQTDINIFGLPTIDWVNLKMSFIWSCFAYMRQERQIKAVKSWAYKTNFDTEENRDIYWHTHTRPDATVLSGVYYLQMPDRINLDIAGTEFAPNGVEDPESYFIAPAKIGQWIVFPGASWHRPGIIQSNEWRYIVAADMEI